MSFGLNSDVENKLKQVFLQFDDIKKIYIFGSRAQGNYTRISDIDFVVYGEKFNKLSKLRSSMEDLSIIYTVDIVHFEKIKDNNLIKQIEKTKKEFL